MRERAKNEGNRKIGKSKNRSVGCDRGCRNLANFEYTVIYYLKKKKAN